MKPTAMPDINTQVVNELKGAVGTAKATTYTILQNLPVYLTRLVIAGGVILIGWLLWKFIRFIITRTIHRRNRNLSMAFRRAETTRSVVVSIIGYIWYFIVVAIALGFFGLDITSILAAAGVVGIAVAFGAQTLVKDLLSGIFIWTEKSLTVGDVVTINDLSGTVESMSIRTTTIRNFNGNVFIIPNGEIRNIINMSRGFKRAIVNVPCPYDENTERLVDMIREEMEIAATEIEGIDTVPDVMSIVSFEQNSLTVQVAVPCPVGQHWRVERDIRSRIKARFDREGIIMPHYTIPKQ